MRSIARRPMWCARARERPGCESGARAGGAAGRGGARLFVGRARAIETAGGDRRSGCRVGMGPTRTAAHGRPLRRIVRRGSRRSAGVDFGDAFGRDGHDAARHGAEAGSRNARGEDRWNRGELLFRGAATRRDGGGTSGLFHGDTRTTREIGAVKIIVGAWRARFRGRAGGRATERRRRLVNLVSL